ncbi:unnamed protein product [Paramecium pentaurelia]|uniref:Uncharacterized protein n=1 Tax=Paramecium pentaurelia TaxID=43138 RepID=A0A8S1TE29_9CILI|nr:unnamed protein product [Paramecium pentaurelia]
MNKPVSNILVMLKFKIQSQLIKVVNLQINSKISMLIYYAYKRLIILNFIKNLKINLIMISATQKDLIDQMDKFKLLKYSEYSLNQRAVDYGFLSNIIDKICFKLSNWNTYQQKNILNRKHTCILESKPR